ncbi:MAG: hypothetical protein ACRD18_14195 [Terriglobia bacterium]
MKDQPLLNTSGGSDDNVDVGQDSRTLDRGTPSPQSPSAIAKGVICSAVAESVAGAFGDRLRALILTGSLARDEATVLEKNGTRELLGDAEFLLVFAEGVVLPSAGAIHRLGQEIEGRLAQRGVHSPLDLDAVHSGFLRELRPHIFAYELRTCGQVVWGDQQILSLIPASSGADIPLEDAWRLLSNRMIEQLDAAIELASNPSALPRSVQYRTVKLYQDMATSFLVFAGAYEPTYRGRAERLRALAADPSTSWDLPFPLHEFSNRVSACTNFKLQGNQDGSLSSTGDCPPSIAFWQEAVTQARLLWRWELMRLTHSHAALSDQELMKKWMSMQPLRDRLRGWAYVLRRCGWHRSWREWPRWVRRARQASPRYCVYAAASQLFFQLPGALGPASQPPAIRRDWEAWRSWLPMDHHDPKVLAADWQQAIFAISENYKRFLTGTRA